MIFKFDPRDFPDNLKPKQAQKEFQDAVLDKLNDPPAGIRETDPLYGAVVGMLLLDGETDLYSQAFESAFWAVRGEAAGSTPISNGARRRPNKAIYDQAAKAIAAFSGHNNTVYYQELAYVARQLIANTDSIPADDPTFSSQIHVYDDDYVSGGPRSSGGLGIPEITDLDGSAAPDDIRKPNIQAVGVTLASYYLEQAHVFEAVDRVLETWWNGQLPVTADSRISKLDDFFWDGENRLTANARHMQYSRVLGIPGGEVSTEVQPNLGFMDNLQRFVANLVEYDRQRRIGDVVGAQRANALTSTAELVRQSGRNLAANASLYGWGGTQFAARRLSNHIKKAFEILNIPAVQAAYGVDGPWKVVERVSQEIGPVPNVVKWRTLALAGDTMLDLVAQYAKVWSGGTGKPLFADDASQIETANVVRSGFTAVSAEVHQLTQVLAAVGKHGPALTKHKLAPLPKPAAADISDVDRDELIRQAGNYVAVNGIQDDTVAQLSQPVESQFAPSIPSLTSAMPTNGGAGIDQLKQMVAQGQVPSLDQLKSIVMPGA